MPPQDTYLSQSPGMSLDDPFFSVASVGFNAAFGRDAEAGAPSVSGDVPPMDQPRLGIGRAKSRPKVFAVNPRDAEEVSLLTEPGRDGTEVRFYEDIRCTFGMWLTRISGGSRVEEREPMRSYVLHMNVLV